jgi:hypothetical protein
MLSINIDEESCYKLIVSHHKTFFNARQLAEEIIADQYDVKLKYVIDCLKRLNDPYQEDRDYLRPRLLHVLKRLKEKGLIEKYNYKFWRIVKNE